MPPTELKVAPLSGGAHLTWKDNSKDETQFVIERKVGAAAFTNVATVPFDATQYHDAPLVSGTTYVYRVMAMGPKDAMALSNEVSFAAP